MGYKMPNVVKEIYLPIPGKFKPLDEYKEEYGIDLREFIDMSDNAINLRFGNAKVYLVFTKEYIVEAGETFSHVVPITFYNIQTKHEGSGAITQIGFSDEYNKDTSMYGLALYGSSETHSIDTIDIAPIIL